ncbi:hypothetical protein [Flavobacterium chungangensis]|uniref:Peptidase S74 domain-containing protein n=1 Tax=Flavobacterium chungangensis TaxID=2708132 RepID=A0ABV8Z8P8_9FLAO
MKNKFLPLLFVLASYGAYSQTGIGTLNPNASAQLEVLSLNKGVLFPRVALTGSTDATTITKGNVNSLFVFNTATALDVVPGYYYWYDNKWVKVASSDDINGIPEVPGPPGTPGAITTLNAIVKDPAGNIYAYVGKDDTVAGREEAWTKKSTDWVKINGLNGPDGIPGADGPPGTPGSITTLDAILKYGDDIYAYVGSDKTVALRDKSWADKDGKWVKINGLDGSDGIAGGPGVPGVDAENVPTKAKVWIDTRTGFIYVKDDAGNWKKVNGNDGIPGVSGPPGTDGAIKTLDAIIKDPDGNIYAYVGQADTPEARQDEWKAKSINWVKINGLNGTDGIPGAGGPPGADGAITTLDAILKYGDDVYAYVGSETTVAGRQRSWKDQDGGWIKINGLDGSDGIAGGPGVPGKDGVTAPKKALVWIDTKTGFIYVKDPVTETWAQVTFGRGELKSATALLKVTGGKDRLVEGDATVEIVPGSKNQIMTTDDVGAVSWASAVDIAQANEPWFAVATKKGATSNTEDIYTNGWVGIGFDEKTTPAAPNEKLRVNGAITTVGSYYADYVFEDYFQGFSDIKADYKFKSLDAVDAFIKANKHLPGITPINELEKTNKGYSFNVSELSIQLLEKTEELYLHVIEQKKELDAKNNEIQMLNQRLEKLEKLVLDKK